VTATIRNAASADVPAMAALVAASYRSAFLPIIGEEGLRLRDVAHFEGRLARELAHLRVAEDGGIVLGMSEVREGNLDMLFIAPGSTGLGLGALLLADAEARGAVTLECFVDNVAALRFYRRRGWREAARYERPFAGASHRFLALAKP
jgi:putative acetyltransferase